MSDEEKKAIKYIKNILNYEKLYYHDGIETNFLRPVDKENVKTVLNLIEKQSKEIEELKSQIDEHVYYDLGGRSCGKTELLRHYKKGYDMNNKFWKDKIKAKIEEEDKLFFKTKDIRHANRYKAYKELLEKE